MPDFFTENAAKVIKLREELQDPELSDEDRKSLQCQLVFYELKYVHEVQEPFRDEISDLRKPVNFGIDSFDLKAVDVDRETLAVIYQISVSSFYIRYMEQYELYPYEMSKIINALKERKMCVAVSEKAFFDINTFLNAFVGAVSNYVIQFVSPFNLPVTKEAIDGLNLQSEFDDEVCEIVANWG